MLNFRKRIFLFLTIIAVVLGFAACTDASNTVRISFDSQEYEIRMQEVLDLEPTIKGAASVDMNAIEVVYESSDESVVRYVHGRLYPVSEGEAEIKVYWKDKEVVFDKATVRVIKPALPTLIYSDGEQFLKNEVSKLTYSLHKNYTDATVEFVSLNPEVATIEDGVVTAVALGTANVRAIVSDYEEVEEYFFTIEVVESDFAITYDLAGGVNAEGNPVGYNALEVPLPLANPTREGYEFTGWLLDNQVTFEIPAGTYGDIKLVATWELKEYAIGYELAGGEVAEGNPTTYTIDQLPLALTVNPTREGYTFTGWEVNGVSATEIAAGTIGDVAVVATWKADTHNINFDLDGGEFAGKYASREAMVADFIKDFNAFAGASITGAEQYWGHSQKTNFWKNDEMHAKWSWIFKALVPFAKAQGQDSKYLENMYAAEKSISGYATQNVAIYLLGINSTIWNELYKTDNGGLPSRYTTVDCTSEEVQASWVSYVGMSASFTTDEEVVLPVPTRYGYEFIGWYEGETKVEKIAAGTTHDVSVKAVWELAEYSISYDVNGGDPLFEEYTSAEIGADFLADLNKYGNSQLTVSTFFKGSTAPIKATFAAPEMLAKWNWLFVYMRAHLAEYNKDNLDVNYVSDTLDLLEDIIAGDTTAMSASGAGANLRTLVRSYMAGVMNNYKGSDENASFQKYSPDFSDPAVQAGLVAAYNASHGPTTSYTVLSEEIVLPTPTRAGYKFLGWYAGDKLVEKIAAGSTGDVAVVAKWQGLTFAISYETDGGVLPENAPTTYIEGSGCELPTPTKEGFKFKGWILGEELVTSLSNTQTGDVKLTAKWEEIVIKYEVYVGEGLDYATLDEAIADVLEGSKIYLAAGEYTLSAVINKSVQIIGPNANLSVNAERGAEAVIVVTADVYGNLNAKDIVFNGVHIKGNNGTNNSGVYFQNNSNIGSFSVLSSVISDLNTFLKSTNTSNSYNVLIQDTKIHSIGQFVVWATKGLANLTLKGNYVDGSTCGTINNTAAALFRVRIGKLEAYNNFFNGDSSNQPGYFESIAEESYVKYNTFANVTKFAHPTAANKLVFDENLYLDANDAVLASSPVVANGVTADVTVCTSEEDRAQRYDAFVNQNAPKVYAITFNPDGGVIAGEVPSEYVSSEGLATLPEVSREGYKFLGWYLNDELVALIAAGTEGDLELVAKWEEIVVASEYNITYDLAEGQWPSSAIKSHAEMAAQFVKDYSEYINAECTVPGFMDTSYSYGNLDDFFDDARYNAKWGWVRTFVTEYTAKVGDKYASNIADKNAEYHNTILRANVHGFINLGQWAKWPASADYSGVAFADYESKLPAGEIVEGPKTYVFGSVTQLVTPVKDGYDFAGWVLGSQVITEITADIQGDITLVARWRVASGEEGVIYVGAEREYKSLGDALAVAMPGDTIKVDAGSYEGATISVANVTILGANAGINPVNGTRVAESVFATDIVVAADNVTIDGLQITGKARIVGGSNGCANVTVKNLWIYQSTINDANVSTNAPLYFSSNVEGVVYSNLVFDQIKNSDTTETRPMAAYFDQVDGLTITNSYFYSKRSSYNDAVKTGSAGSYGVKGKVEIVGNHFENFSQYVLWFAKYGAGEFNVQNNVIKNCGQTSSSHCAIRFDNYAGPADGLSAINFLYNTVDNSYMLFRMDKSESRNAETQPVHVNYNKLLNCGATYYVKNDNAYQIDATNNYYDVAPTSSVMTNCNWEPYYANEGDVPLYGQELSFYAIEYVTNGGAIAENAPAMYDSKVGLASLPEISKEGHIFQGWLLNGVVVTEIAAGTTGKVVLEASFRENALYVSKNGESYAYATIAEALAAAKEGDKIIITAGEWDEEVVVSIANLTIAGPNQGVDAVNGTRVAEAIIKNVINVDVSAKNLTIDGLSFTAGGRVVASATNANYEGFTFKNNKLYDTNPCATSWVDNRYQMNAVVEFKLAKGGSAKDFEIFNNSFVNCDGLNLLVNRAYNLSVDSNVFKNFTQDAIRIEGGYSNGIHAFTNNTFEVEKNGDAYNAIFFYSISGGSAETKVVIKNNTFKNLGTDSSALYDGVISARTYQEYPTSFDISDNVFDHCYNYFWLRNNGATASIWSAKIENNQFLGLPNDYYFGSYNGTGDTESTNPHLAVFGANYYEDNDGNVISDMATIAGKFYHLASYGTALAAKPEAKVADRYEFWSISYDLGGGSAKGLVYEYTIDTGAIVLPTPTWNIYHEFANWTLNGQVVTEIPAGTKGDLHLVANWTEIEGNPVTLEFELNGGNWHYSSFTDICEDLLSDYNSWGGTNYTAANLPAGAWVNINIHNFYYSDGMSEKWAWLAAWLGEVGGNANKPGCKALLTYSDAASFDAANGNFKYAVSYEFRAIMRGSSITDNVNYKTPDYSDPTLNAQIWEPLVKAQSSTLDTTEGKILTLPKAHKQYLSFAGWYDNAELTGEPITVITVGATNPKLYAKYVDLNPVTEIKVSNAITEINRFLTHQLTWEVLPEAAANKAVNFVSTEPSVATVSTDGLITAIKDGTTTIRVISAANDSVIYEFTLTVKVPAVMKGHYETTSYVKVNENIVLGAEIVKGTGTVVWSSADDSVATVVDGVVTAHKAGTVIITAKSSDDETVKADFFVTVLEGEISEQLQFILDNHNANIFTSYNLGIGAGTPAYYSDIYSSVSKILFNHELVINTSYLDKGNNSGDYYKDAHLEEQYGGIQFVTFHYTAGFAPTADTDNHASYFTGGSADVSIHYITGNKGTEGYEVYNTLSHDHGAWHAGDSNARYYSNSTLVDANGWKRFQWIPTGVAYDGSDLLDIEWSASDDFYFEINGQKTTIKLPDTYDYKSRNTDHIYNSDGTISSQGDLTFEWARFQNRTPESFFTDQGFAVNVIDGMYYMGPTWWSYGQVVEGRIASAGGNLNSIGIESCVNEGTDLWLTWQITGQLIAKLLYENDLTIDRVKGHHFFDGKDCPQPLLENDLEIWNEIIECIKAELEIITTHKDVKIEMVSNNPDIVDNQGRVISVPTFTQAVSYTVTITYGDKVETVTLGSIVPGIYEK